MNEGITFHWYDIESDPKGWDRQVSGVGQSLFHRNAMLEAHQPAKTFRRGVMITRAERTIGLLGGLLRPGHGGARFHTLSFLRYQRHLHPRLPQEVGNWLLEQGVTQIELGCLDGGVEEYQGNHGGRISNRCEFIYDLSRSEEERLRLLSGNHRRKLSASDQQPVHFGTVAARQAWLMTRLHRCWARRRGERYGLRRMCENYRYYRRLTLRLAQDESATLYGLQDQRGGLLALAYMLERADSGFYLFGAESEEGNRRGSGVRLLWELARRYPQRGVLALNLGSVPADAHHERHRDHSLYRFRLGFGIEPTLRQSLSIEV